VSILTDEDKKREGVKSHPLSYYLIII